MKTKQKGFNIIESMTAIWIAAIILLMTIGVYIGMNRASQKGMKVTLASEIANKVSVRLVDTSAGVIARKDQVNANKYSTIFGKQKVQDTDYYYIAEYLPLEKEDGEITNLLELKIAVFWAIPPNIAHYWDGLSVPDVQEDESVIEHVIDISQKSNEGQDQYGKTYIRFSRIIYK